MKKLPYLIAFVSLALPAFALAQSTGFVPIAPIPGLTQGATADSQGMANFFNNLYIFLIGFAAVAAVIEIIIGGVQYATTDNISHKSEGKARIQQAILGLILVLMPVLVFSIINPQILKLEVGWEKVKVPPPSTPPGSLGSGTGSTSTTTPSGCQVTNAGNQYLQSAFCPTAAAASQWLNTSPCSGMRITQTNGACNSSTCQVTVTCEGRTPVNYTFINIGSDGIFSSTKLQPLVNQASGVNASDVAPFHQGCRTAGGSLCVWWSRPVKALCPSYSTFLPSGTDGGCMNSQLSCFSQADAASANSTLSGLNPLNILSATTYSSCESDLEFVDTPLP